MQAPTRQFLLAVLLALAPCLASGQSFEIVQSTIDAGGGTSAGGEFSLTGTIGQPDTGNSAGGNFGMAGGFWEYIITIQTPGAPQLSISRDVLSGGITVSWTLPDDGWVLDQSNSLGAAPAPWLLVPQVSYQNTATHRFVVFPAPGAFGYFRLRAL